VPAERAPDEEPAPTLRCGPPSSGLPVPGDTSTVTSGTAATKKRGVTSNTTGASSEPQRPSCDAECGGTTVAAVAETPVAPGLVVAIEAYPAVARGQSETVRAKRRRYPRRRPPELDVCFVSTSVPPGT